MKMKMKMMMKMKMEVEMKMNTLRAKAINVFSSIPWPAPPITQPAEMSKRTRVVDFCTFSFDCKHGGGGGHGQHD